MITEMNAQMAERLLARESQFDHKAMRKSIEEYESIKKTMSNNKKAMMSSKTRPSLPALDRKADSRKGETGEPTEGSPIGAGE